MTAKLIARPSAIDVRTLPPPQRHPRIFGTFDALAPGEAFEIVNDHDPLPLFFQFDRTRTGQFDWHYLQQGPAVWQVRIARVAEGQPLAEATGCGGQCRCSS
jgi:uncharacterized protein (DUF2249 family)